MGRKEILTLNRSINPNRKESNMGAGGIIQKHAAVLLVAVTDPSMYDSLSPSTKSTVDTIDAKEPLSRTEQDVKALLKALQEACGC